MIRLVLRALQTEKRIASLGRGRSARWRRMVYVRKVIERALAHKASGFVVVHNHPSGDPTPSDHDREVTRALKLAAATVGVRLLDHLIIGEAASFSFRGNGLL